MAVLFIVVSKDVNRYIGSMALELVDILPRRI